MNTIEKALEDTGREISRELKNSYLDWFNESVFRYFFIKSLSKHYPKNRFETEWKRFDLLMTDGEAGTIIEFKFYFLNKHSTIDDKFKRFKGGPGKKNDKEFENCLERMSLLKEEGIHDKYLIVVYEETNNSKSFGKNYNHIEPAKLKQFNVSQICKLDYFIVVSKKENRALRAKVLKVQ
ncbi:hypothetical protein [Methanoregula sp.]|uniref:hypothetical protein n=1 Tax=Methanoregula sp. TaxID=2052170 RepID=UPI003BB02311